MSYADDPEAWQRLRDLYAQMPEEQLLELDASFDDLTDDAQGILRSELASRKLSAQSLVPQPVAELPPEPTDEAEEMEGDGYTPWQLLQMAGVPLCECDTTEEAEFVCFILGKQDIYAAVRQNLGPSDLRLPQVLVAPDDLEKAGEALSRVDAAALRPQFEAESAVASADFVLPKCPTCSSEELLLESIDPTNTWLCESCGVTWQEQPGDPEEPMT